jgi:hypothetical protein
VIVFGRTIFEVGFDGKCGKSGKDRENKEKRRFIKREGRKEGEVALATVKMRAEK